MEEARCLCYAIKLRTSRLRSPSTLRLKLNYASPCNRTPRRFSSLHAIRLSGSRATETIVERLSSLIHGCTPLAKPKIGKIYVAPEGRIGTCQIDLTYGVATFRDKSTVCHQQSTHSSQWPLRFLPWDQCLPRAPTRSPSTRAAIPAQSMLRYKCCQMLVLSHQCTLPWSSPTSWRLKQSSSMLARFHAKYQNSIRADDASDESMYAFTPHILFR